MMERPSTTKQNPEEYLPKISKKLSFLKPYEKRKPEVNESQLRLNSLEPRSNTDKVTRKIWDYLNDNEFGNARQFDWNGNS